MTILVVQHLNPASSGIQPLQVPWRRAFLALAALFPLTAVTWNGASAAGASCGLAASSASGRTGSSVVNAGRSDQGSNNLDISGYTLAFDDEFDKMDIAIEGETSNSDSNWFWTEHKPGSRGFMPEVGGADLVAPRPGGPFSIKQGVLTISARKTGKGWESGEIRSVDSSGAGFSQTYGYFEMCAKLPGVRASWPGFWLLMKNSLLDGSRARGEIDILEAFGEKPGKIFTTVHIRQPPQTPHWWSQWSTPAPEITSGFHRYGANLTPDWIVFYYDGKEIWRAKNRKVFHGPWYMLITNAMQKGWVLGKATSPSDMKIDYVRVYTPPQ